MIQNIQANNRRKFPRFKIDKEIFVLHSDFGKVEEIGMGGMAFTYMEKKGPKIDGSKKGVLFSKKDDYLVELPLRTVSDDLVYLSTPGKPPVRKRVVIFENLKPDQLEQLERFILSNIDVGENILSEEGPNPL